MLAVVAPAAPPPVADAESATTVAVVDGRVVAVPAADPAEASDGSWVTA